MQKVILQRTDKTSIGFSATIRSKDNSKADSAILKDVEPEDLIKYGLIPEFIGRLPVTAVLDELDEEALVTILTEPKNALTKQYQKLFEMEGVLLQFTPDCLRAIAKKAMVRKTGARGLRSIIELALLDLMYRLPSMENVDKVIMDANTIEDGVEPMIIYKNSDLKEGTHQ